MSMRVCCWVLALLLPTGASAQEINFQHFLIPDGLPQTQVQALHQGPEGYLWVGTYGGAGRYNGREFTVFTTRDGLATNTVLAIESSADGRVWMGTSTGLCWMEPGQERFECSAAAQVAGLTVQELLPAPDGGMWAGTAAGLHRTVPGAPGDIARSHLADENIAALALDAAGTLWIGTRAGLYRLEAGGAAPRPVPLPEDAGLVVLSLQADGPFLWIGTEKGLFLEREGEIVPSPRLPAGWTQDVVNDMTLSASGDVWIASNQGVLRHTRDGFELLTEDSGLMSSINFSVMADREGVIWIGNDNGLTKYAPGPFVGYRRKHGLLHYFVRTLGEDAAGDMWLGGRAGVQRVPYRDGDWRFEEAGIVATADTLGDPRVFSIAFPAPGEALLATGDGVVHWREGEGVVRRYTTRDGLPTNQARALLAEPGGRVWIGTNLGVVVLQGGRIDAVRDAELARSGVLRIRADAKGRLWFGSQNPGLFMLADGAYTRLGEAEGLTDNTVWDIAPDASGGVWAGSNGDGLFHVQADGRIRRYTTADGLVNDFVWQVLVDDRDRVWAYTNNGMSRLEHGRFTNYGIDDGLPHLEGSATGALQTRDGTLWFASGDGLARYMPEAEMEVAAAPPVLIERVTVAGRPISDGARLPHLPGLVDIQYAALSFQRARDIEYRYRLLGASDEWSSTERYRPLSFANPGAGDYVFEVTARKGSGDWNPDVARFSFRIAPPFWQTRWFWGLGALTLGAMVWLALWLAVRQARRREQELAQLVSERTRELKVANEQLQGAAITDPLTGLFNRRHLVRQIDVDVALSERLHRTPGSCNRDIVFLMVDLDCFKQINDSHGHAAGDHVLRQFGAVLRAHIRETDYVVRWGGEEFLIVARNTEAALCAQIAERIHRATSARQFVLEDGTPLTVTCSIGVAHFPLFGDAPDHGSWEHAVEIADAAVYMAKRLGRDGWVAIRCHAAGGSEADADELVRRIRSDPAALVGAGTVAIDSSFGPLGPSSGPEEGRIRARRAGSTG